MINLELHCWKCFKLEPMDTVIGDVNVKLCKGCAYEIRKSLDWFHAVGVHLQPIGGPGEEGVVKGRKGAVNGRVEEVVEATP